MRSASILALAACLAAFFPAVLAGPVAAETAPVTVAPEKVLSSVTADWNDDARMDRAVLVEGDGVADLIVYLSDGDNGMMPAAYAPGMVGSGINWGTLPGLVLTAKNGLQVHSENDAIGRYRWDQVLTLAWRNGQFVVAGITYAVRDTLNTEAGGGCDINLLTGKGTSNGKAVTVAAAAIPVAQWSDDKLPAACQF